MHIKKSDGHSSLTSDHLSMGLVLSAPTLHFFKSFFMVLNKSVRFVASSKSGINIISLAPGYGELMYYLAISAEHF